MAFDLNNFVIDRVRRGTMFSPETGEVLWSITQIKDASLNMTSESADVTDAIGSVIMKFDRSKNAEFSASNALFDTNLAAAQFGSKKKLASTETKICVPAYEQLDVKEGKAVLSHIPAGESQAEIKYIYALNNDSSLGTKYELGEAVSASAFTLDAASKTITVPTGVTGKVAVFYEYEAENAVMLENNASDFPTAGKFVMEVIGKDTCNSAKTYYAYVVFPNAKLKPDMDLNFTTDGGHPFSMTMMQDYCDLEKRLFNIYIAE
jgi:hypothetical protein